jgi:hypothetical protein
MKRYSTLMSVLLTLALPVAATCADTAKAPDKKADSSVEATKPETKAETSVEAIKKNVSRSGHGKMMAGSSAAAEGPSLNPSGKVVETMDSGGYTYANLEKDGKTTWVAFPNLETRVGDNLAFQNCVAMVNFPSRTLNRTFPSILFCGQPTVTSNGSSVMSATKSPGSAGTATAGSKKVSVHKASGPNAYTVAEIFAKRSPLDGKQVVVRGQVTKVSSEIMGMNWLHIQDGTGSPKKKSHDLVVTTKDKAAVGDVVTVSGKVAKDKDFGSGYSYSVMIENATIKK